MTSQPPEPADLADLRDRGVALHRAGRLDEARDLYQQVLRRDPNRFDVLLLLGQLLMQMGAVQPAAAVLTRATQVNPGAPAAHGLLSEALHASGRPEEALASVDRALALQPNAQAWVNRGAILVALRRPDEALASYEAAIALDPGLAEAHNNRGLALMGPGRFEEALASFEAAVALKPDYAEAHHSRAAPLLALKRPADALEACDRALALRPGEPGYHNSRGLALNALRHYTEALAAYQRAIALRADFAEALNNRALVLVKLGRQDEAMASLEAAIAARPDYAAPRFGRAVAWLLDGRFDEGWREYEWRRRRGPPPAPPLDDARQWRGEDLAGRTLYVHREQGLGDTIQFARYVKALGEGGARVAFSVQGPLKPLLRQLEPAVAVLGDGEAPPPFDVHCPLLSLPLAFGTTPETIPSPEGYLRADEARTARFAARLGPRGRPRVGLAWSGNPEHDNDHNRSIPFRLLGPLLGADADFACLQDAVRPSDTEAFTSAGRVGFHGGELKDFADTAALVAMMDLVITVDTSLAHLAGALGRPVWILLPFVPDWRWMRDRPDSPWYANARLFRQPRIGDWDSVVEAVRREMAIRLDLRL
ncbi:MAG TPA: tetratricopeptide repeat protein [Caulobacteraceae bacterium]|nr:tetratricopeptide repeat protein [Caulobacteraceae bacterium]